MLSLTLIIGLIVAVIIFLVVVAGVAFALYKAKFRVDKIKTGVPGVIEMEATRQPTDPPAAAGFPPAPRITVEQTVATGGKIEKSGISAPADASAQINQQAADKGQINDSPINLT
jgi:hypothetical protein